MEVPELAQQVYIGHAEHLHYTVPGRLSEPGSRELELVRLGQLEQLVRLGQPGLVVCSELQPAVAVGCQAPGSG